MAQGQEGYVDANCSRRRKRVVTGGATTDYLEGMGDSLDLVPIGAWWGQGRKAGWWSPILLALYNAETGALEAVCKCE
jgi:ATP-dependent DNA ligase